MIVQNVSHEGATDLSFTAPIADVAALEATIGGIAKQVGARNWSSTTASRRSRSSAPG